MKGSRETDALTITNHAAAGILVNCVGSPSELTNVSRMSSHVPRSAKYLLGER